MSTVDKGPSSRISDAANDAVDSVKPTGQPSASTGASGTPTAAKGGSPRTEAAPSAPTIVPKPPTETDSGAQPNASKQTTTKKSSSRASANPRGSDSTPRDTVQPTPPDKPAAPVDPGLAMAKPAAKTATESTSERRVSRPNDAHTSAAPDQLDSEEFPETAEQLVITPVSDVVGPPPERRKRRVRRVVARSEPTGLDRSTEYDEPTAAAPTAVFTSAGDHQTVALPSTVARPTSRGTRRRARVRRVTRVVRHIDPWSAFKAGLLFSLVGYVVLLTSGVLLWQVAEQTGTIDNVQGWFTQFGWETFELKGGEIYHNAWIAGLFLAVGFTGLIVLGVTLFNLVSDIIGGIRISVLEEEVVERRVTTSRRYAVRRPGIATHDPSATNWSVDPDGPASPVATSSLPSTTTNWSVDD